MFPDTIYRVAVKAYITNEANQVLVVKEGQDFWSLPGGGLNHGESPIDCLTREIKEELSVDVSTIGSIVCTKILYLDRADFWMIWMVYYVTLTSHDFVCGDGVTDAKYIDARDLEHSSDIFEKSVFEVATSVV